MSETADVVVVGAGVHGASTAFHLAQRGARVVVLERSTAAAGATGRSSGLVRMHYDLAAESALAWTSFAYFSDWAARVGGDCGFVRTGFLRLVPAEQEAHLRANVAEQQRIGIRTSIVEAADVRAMAPMLATDDFAIAAYEPDSGYADPTSTCTTLLAAARARGARVRFASPVERIELDGPRVVGVRTATVTISAPTVVLAAGAWSAALAASAGVALPIRAWHHDTGFVTRPAEVGAAGLPTVIDDINALYFRPEGGTLALVGLEDGNRIDDRPADDARSDPAFVEHMVERITRRVPGLASAGFRGAHGGTDGITPDQRPVLGTYGPEGLVLQTGFSGTGFKIAPAVGLAISELILDGEARSVDLTPFDAGRFAAGRELRGEHPYGSLWR
ncbi:MAG TPA: FAD-binding oxidoreductase [Candidatus Limnocylindrales bacterium]|nr:FAD-binding oxidoreductase [Candidatus Limnocylindrales bacterium]